MNLNKKSVSLIISFTS